MSPYIRKSWQSERHSKPLVNWTPDTASHKRKRQDEDGQTLRPSKRNKDPPKVDGSNESSLGHSMDRMSPDRIQRILSKVFFNNISTGNSPHDLPELTYSGPTSPPDSDHLSLMDDDHPGQTIQNEDLRDDLQWPKDSPEATSDEYKLSIPDEDSLFSQYLRARSPSCSSTTGFDGNNHGNIHSRTVTPRNICLSAEEDPHLAGLIDQNTVKAKDFPVKAPKTRITLRIRQPEPRPKPKVLLRLSQPKQTQSQKSVRRVKPGVYDRRRRRTGS